MKAAAIVSGLALVASVVTPVFADEIVGPPAPQAEVIEEAAPAAVEAEKPAGKPLELRPTRSSDSGGAGGFGVGMKLAAVAAVFGGAFLLFKRKNGGFAAKTRTPGTNARIVSRTAVGMRNELLVVEVEGQRLLIGVTPAAMSTLSVLAEEPKEMLEEPQSEAIKPRNISGYDLRIDDDFRASSYRPAAPPAAPMTSSAVEESLSRLIASARNDMDDAGLTRKTPTPKVTQLRASRAKTEKADKAEKTESADKADSTPVPRKTRGALREVASLEGQVRGLTAKRV
jgi:flagellar biogenesis protein FliO